MTDILASPYLARPNLTSPSQARPRPTTLKFRSAARPVTQGASR